MRSRPWTVTGPGGARVGLLLAEQVRAAQEALEARDAHAAQEAQEAPAHV